MTALVLDEHYSPVVAAELRRRGHDVTAASASPLLVRRSDAELFRYAAQAHRRIVTENVADFRLLQAAALTEGQPAGTVLYVAARRYPRRGRCLGKLIEALDSWLADNPDAVGPEMWLP
jgi:hypothetical protein